MKTKISLVLLGLGLATASAYAGHMAEPMPVSNDINVTAPDQAGSWSFGGTVVLLQPTMHAFNYATTESFVDFPNARDDTDFATVDTNYKWWFGADITYHFPGNGRDVTLAYEGLHGTSNTDKVLNPNGPISETVNPNTGVVSINAGVVSGFATAGNNGATNAFISYPEAEAKIKTAYDAGDLLFGQKIDVGTRVRLHPFAGLRYAHVNVDSTANYIDGVNLDTTGARSPIAGYFEEGEVNSTYNGIGPRFGSDAQVNLGDGFSVRGRVGLSALIGTLSVDNDDTIVNPTQFPGQSLYTTDDVDSQTRVVPELDARLGLNYTYAFDTGMALGIEAGWEAISYFNAVNNDPLDVTADGNFALQGPYARLQFDIA